MLKGIEKLTGQKKLFCQSAWWAATAYAAGKCCVCPMQRRQPALQDSPAAQKEVLFESGADCPVRLLSGSWWRMAPPAASQLMMLLWEVCRSAASLLKFTRNSVIQFCACTATVWQVEAILCSNLYSSLWHDVDVHSSSRLAWMNTVVLTWLFFIRGAEAEFWHILGVWMQWQLYQHHPEFLNHLIPGAKRHRDIWSTSFQMDAASPFHEWHSSFLLP